MRKIFLDSSKLDEIKKYKDMGIISGVTTNPTIMKKDGVEDVVEHTRKIIKTIPYRPVSVELTRNDSEKDMIKEAKLYRGLSPDINVKVPIHSPEGKSNLGVIKKLSNIDIPVNCTAMMSAQQLILANMAGAEYVSLFGGRVADMGHDPKEEIYKYVEYKKHTLEPANIIMGSVRETHNIIDWFTAGADIVTVPPKFLDKMIVHARTKETVKMFMEDASQYKIL